MIITFEKCKSKIPSDSVCTYCGGGLDPIETVDNSGNPTHWVGCLTCCRFNYGVPKEAFELAKEINGEHEMYGRLSNVAIVVATCYQRWAVGK